MKVAAAPGTSTVPSAGAVMVRMGGLATTSAIRASAVCPLASVTRAVTVWSPWLRFPAVIVAPLPRLPSRSELHTTREPRAPLSASTAVALKVTAVPRSTVAFGTGAVIVTSGARFWASAIRSWGFPPVASRLA